jgi:putative copper export protein/methionine-rich copper-binding protein CopC
MVCLLALLACACPTAADAHAYIDRSQPQQESELMKPPSEIRVRFTEKINTSMSQLRVKDSSGAVIPGTLTAEGEEWLVLKIPALPNGVYRVEWQVLSVDSHVTEGSYRFTVGVPLPAVRPAETVSLDGSPAQPAAAEPDKPQAATNPPKKVSKPLTPGSATVVQPQQKPQPAKTESTVQPPRPAEQPKPQQQPNPSTAAGVPTPPTSDVTQQTQSSGLQQQPSTTAKAGTTVSEQVQVVDGSTGEAPYPTAQGHDHHGHEGHDVWNRSLRIAEIFTASLVAGVLFLRWWPGFTERMGQRWQTGSVERAVFFAAFLLFSGWGTLQVWMLADMLSGEAGLLNTLGTILTSTSVGVVSWGRPAMLLLLTGLSFLRETQLVKGSKTVLVVFLLATFPLTGHAASDEGWSAILSHTIHFLAGIIWVAGLSGLVALSFVLPRQSAEWAVMHRLLGQFAQIALLSVTMVAASGLLLSLFRLSAWEQLGTTPYGVILTVKVAVFVVALLFAAVHRYVYLPKWDAVTRDQSEVPNGLVWTLRAELFAALLVLAAAGVLSTTSPPF